MNPTHPTSLADWFPFWLEGTLEAAALLIVAWAAAVVVARRASAANRHALWLAALLGVLVLPVTSALVASGRMAGATALAAPVVVHVPLERATHPPRPATTTTAHGGVEDPATARGWTMRTPGWRTALVGAWALGVVGMLGWRALGAVQLRRLRRQTVPLPAGRVRARAEALAEELAGARPGEWRRAPGRGTALTWGTRRPVVLLPAAAEDWDDARLERVLRHELAHVARRDCFSRLVAQIACALYWPLPLAWLAARRLREAQEEACDDAVLTAGAAAVDYAEDLVAAARARGRFAWAAAAVAMAERSSLERRICGLLDEQRARGRLRRRTMLGAGALVTLALAGCAAVQVRETEAAASPPAKSEAPVDALSQIDIEAKFVEFDPAEGTPLELRATALRMERGAGRRGRVIAVMPAEAAASLLQQLGPRKGTEVLSAPRVTVLDGQPATITVAQELRYPELQARPTPAEMPGVQAASEPAFKSRNVGVEFEVFPKLTSTGQLIVALGAKVTQLEGYLEIAPGPDGEWDTAADPATAHLHPIFAARRWRELLDDIGPGQTVVLTNAEPHRELGSASPQEQALLGKLSPAPDANSAAAANARKEVWIFVTLHVLDPLGRPAVPAAAAEPESRSPAR